MTASAIQLKQPAQHFGVFRILFGLYLTWHFACLLPYASELFGATGIFGSNHPSPFRGAWPNPLFLSDWAPLAVSMVGLGVLSSLFLTIGRLRRSSAIYLWFLSTCLFTANPLIANPSLGYTGLLLLLTALTPSGEAFILKKPSQPNWNMPYMIPITAWILLSVGYTFSGFMKLDSPSWIDGSALKLVLENPLARPNFLRDLLLQLPEFALSLLTWSTLLLELLFLPLALYKKTRPWAWLAMIGMHLGIMLVIDFADLSIGMLMVHLFTYQPSWFTSKKSFTHHFLRLKKFQNHIAALSLSALCIISFSCATKAPIHNGTFPFSTMDKAPNKGQALKRSQQESVEKLKIIANYSPQEPNKFQPISKQLRAGDIIAFSMSHTQAREQLRKFSIQKIPYEFFRFGHLAILTHPSSSDTRNLHLLQVAMKQQVNVDSDLSYLKDKSWIVYRAPDGSISSEKLTEFTLAVCSKHTAKYDYTATVGIFNGNIHPSSDLEFKKKYTCATLAVAALHHAGFQLHTLHRKGYFDIITPRQVVDSWGSHHLPTQK